MMTGWRRAKVVVVSDTRSSALMSLGGRDVAGVGGEGNWVKRMLEESGSEVSEEMLGLGECWRGNSAKSKKEVRWFIA